MVEYKIDCRSDNRPACEFWRQRLNKNKIHKFKFPPYIYRERSWLNQLKVKCCPAGCHLQQLTIFADATLVSSIITAAVCPRRCSLNALDCQLVAGGKVWRNVDCRWPAGWCCPQWRARGEGQEKPWCFCFNFPQKYNFGQKRSHMAALHIWQTHKVTDWP